MSRIRSYAGHMAKLGIHPDQLGDVYELAVSIYNDEVTKGPFGVDYWIQAGKAIIAEKQAKVDSDNVKIFVKPVSVKRLGSCSDCDGSKLSFRREDGKIVGLNRDAKGNVMACRECK